MPQVEAVDTSTAVRAGRVRGAVLEEQSDLFARVLETTRDSTQRLAEMLKDRGGQKLKTPRRDEYLAGSLAEERRAKAITGKPDRPRPEGPGRADQLKDLQERLSRCQPAPEQAAESPDDAGASAEDQQSSRLNPSEAAPSVAGEGSQTPQGVVASDQPTVQGDISSTPAQMYQTVTDSSRVGPTAVAGEGAASSPPVGTAGSVSVGMPSDSAGSPDGTGGASVGIAGPRVAANAPQGQLAGRDGGSGQSSDANFASTAKNSEAVGRSTGSADEFQNVLDTAGRLRARMMASPARAAALIGNNDASAKGVNLNEARAMTDLSQIIRSSIGSRRSIMTLRLQPPELGQLRIEVRMLDRTLTLRMETETIAGRDAIQARLGDLRQALERHGIQLNQVEVELRPPSTEASQARTPDEQQQPMHDSGDAWPGSAGSQQAGDQAGAGRDLPGAPFETDQNMTLPGAEAPLDENGFDPVAGLAETGIDLVV